MREGVPKERPVWRRRNASGMERQGDRGAGLKVEGWSAWLKSWRMLFANLRPRERIGGDETAGGPLEVLTMACVVIDPNGCSTCKRAYGERHRACTKVPSLRTLEKWMDDGVAKATDGCRVEPDGKCPHGHNSWLMVMGLI